MGDVILFEPRRRQGSARRLDGESIGAQIMFFTGVRYQRMTDAACAEATGGRPSSDDGLGRKRKRKRG